jgi:hypothetical protein
VAHDREPGAERALAVTIAVVLAAALMSVPSVDRAARSAAPTTNAHHAGLDATWYPLPEGPAETAADVVLVPEGEPPPAEEEPAALPVSAEAAGRAHSEPHPPAATQDVQERGRQALDAMRYPWQELGYTVRFEPARGQRVLGWTDAASRTIVVYVRPGQSEHSLRVTLAHEIGHALDFVTGDDAQRARYLELRGLRPGTPWFPCDRCSDYASPAGDWAEVFALWMFGPGDFRSEMAGPPDQDTLRAIVPLFAPPSARRSAAPAPAPTPTPSQPSKPRPLLPIGPGL